MKKEDKYYIRYCEKCPFRVVGNWEFMVVKQFKDHEKKHKKKPVTRRQAK